jgi:transcriptional regulator with XRE-family HTH domain
MTSGTTDNPADSGTGGSQMSRDRRIRTEQVAKKFGRNLWFHRRKVGLSQEELADRASVHRTAIGMLEKGARLPGVDTMIRLYTALSVPPTQLLVGIEWIPATGHQEGVFEIDEEVPYPRTGTAEEESHLALGRAVRMLREEAGLSVADLAGRLRLEKLELEAMERGEVHPNFGELKRVAHCLDTSLPAFFNVVERFERQMGS